MIKKYFTKTILLLIFSLSLFIKCWSSDGLWDTQECAMTRSSNSKSYRKNLNLYLVLGCANPTKENQSPCSIVGYELFLSSSSDCGDPGIPFPWYKREKGSL